LDHHQHDGGGDDGRSSLKGVQTRTDVLEHLVHHPLAVGAMIGKDRHRNPVDCLLDVIKHAVNGGVGVLSTVASISSPAST
jgi:hypothetical protein